MGQETTVDFSWNRPINQIIADKVLRDNKTLLFMATTWHRLYDPFVPMETGLMAHDSVDVYVEDGLGIIHHKAPYSAANYYGEGRNFSKEKHPLATAQWDEAAKSSGKKEALISDVEAFIKRGGS